MTVASWWAELIHEPAGAVVTLTPGTPDVQVTQHHFLKPEGALVTITGGTPSLVQTVRPDGAAVTITPGTPDVYVRRVLQPDAASVSITPGTPKVTLLNQIRPAGASVSVTPGTPVVSVFTPTPPAFDAMGNGTQAQAASWTYSHTATAGAYVIAELTFDRAATVNSLTYGGTAMTLLGTVNHNNTSAKGFTRLYGLANAPGGAQTVAVSLSDGSGWAVSNTFSYTGVASVGTVQTVFGLGTSLAQSVSRIAGQRIVQAFGHGESATGNGFTSPSGGTNRWNQNSNVGSASATFSDAVANTNFAASCASSCNWAGIALVLSS